MERNNGKQISVHANMTVHSDWLRKLGKMPANKVTGGEWHEKKDREEDRQRFGDLQPFLTF